jgi:hypothetical protein
MRKAIVTASATLALLAGIAAPVSEATMPQTIPSVLTFKVPVTVAEAGAWAEATLTGAGVDLPANTEVIFSNSNCGADISAVAMGGCTYTLTDRTVVVLSPGLAWTEAGSHILFHEVGHAMGIMDECEAEAYAHNFEDVAYWSYPQCNA